MKYRLNLQQFAEDGAAAAPETADAETATAAEPVQAAPAETPTINAGDTLPDGTTVQNAQVAAALKRQMDRHPELRQVYGQKPQAQNPAAAAPPAERTIEERWDEVKKGEFAELYGRDVQNAVRDRFKNQMDANQSLTKLEPMLKVLRDRAGVGTNDELVAHVLDDDSLYEEEADKQGMTVPAYREFKNIQNQLTQMQQQEAQREAQERIRQHYDRLKQQETSMKELYPDFSLKKELQNPAFLRMTSPEGGISVEDAYYAIHHKELAPQMMAYGMQRAKAQMGQTLQAQRSRPVEGAVRAQGQPAAQMKMNPKNMTREERAEIKRQVRLGKRVSFD